MHRLCGYVLVVVGLLVRPGLEVYAQPGLPSDLSVQSVAVTAVDLDRVGPSTAICRCSRRSTE